MLNLVELRIVLVGIEGPVNLGVIARTCVNFNVKELYLVKPIASIEEALRYAAHGKDLLHNSIVVDKLEDALRDVDISAATSALGYSEKDLLRQAVSIEDFINKTARGARRIALIFGRESTGLTREELLKADYLVTIPANPEYPILNVSQSIAIFLWEFWKRRGIQAVNIPPRASREQVNTILNNVEKITSLIMKSEDKKYRCNLVWKRILYRSLPSINEAKVLLYWIRRVERKIEKTPEQNPI